MQILVATGGSAHSALALTFAAHLAQRCDATLTVLTVVKREADRPRGEAILETARFMLDPLLPGSGYETRLRVGHPAEEIVAEAEQGDYRLVVVGEKQHHGLMTRFVLGSTAERVIEHAPCPVVVVKGQVGPVERVLICDSGLQEGAIVERVAAQLPALLSNATAITVLHVMSQMGAGPGVDGHQLRADAAQLIEEHAPEGELLEHDVDILADAGLRSRPKVRHGLVVDEILAEAREGAYDLVIIGAHQGSGWHRILLDDISHQIVVGLDRPVLVIH
ncbi:MAG: universal stress protein [Chloroflexota bacterium]|nr:universal stress protein [Chloroflexota bacterium]